MIAMIIEDFYYWEKRIFIAENYYSYEIYSSIL